MTRVFKGLKDASTWQKGRKLGAGKYDLAIRGVNLVGRGENFFCAELTILACDDAVDHLGEPFKAGDEVSYLVNMINPKYPELPLANVKAFMLALDPETPADEIGEAQAEELVGPEQPARGLIIHCTAVTDRQKGDPNKRFTYPNWSPASDSTYERYRSQLDELFGGDA